MRILVLRGGALGDFLVTLPALALLRQRWPDARIELAGQTAAAGLALSRGLIDAVHSQHESRWAALYGHAPLPAEFAGWLSGFDLVLNYWPDPDRELAGRFPLRPTQTFLSASPLPSVAPAAAHYCTPLRELGLMPGQLVHPLRVPAPDARLVAIHPGSGSPKKNWPLERWRELGRWLEHDLKVDVVTVLGEAEPPGTLAGVGLHLRSLPLEELANRFAGCGVFVGHDSGITHLAAACGAPCIALFGPTDPAVWAPPSPRVTVLQRGPDLAAISLADVQAAVRAALPGRS